MLMANVLASLTLAFFTFSYCVLTSSSQNVTSNASCLILPATSCGTGNPIDDCWRCDPNWDQNRTKLADCAIGFGRDAIGGRNGKYYVVTEAGDDDPVNPKPGTLRYGVIQEEPLWIIFAKDMNLTFQKELLVSSYKTIDARGATVRISGGDCIVVQNASHVIIHGLHIHNCIKTAGLVRTSPSQVQLRAFSDGDGISIFGSNNVWVDHNTLSNCSDGLVDATHVSTNITISNNLMTYHDKVMLLGHSDSFPEDKVIQITVTLNRFGEGLVQRMPRCRYGNFHVVNNDYQPWTSYAIGGSSNPTINSQGNRFRAPNSNSRKQLTWRAETDPNVWSSWNWRFQDELLLNGAKFVSSGSVDPAIYVNATSLIPMPSSLVGAMTKDAGALSCKPGYRC